MKKVARRKEIPEKFINIPKLSRIDFNIVETVIGVYSRISKNTQGNRRTVKNSIENCTWQNELYQSLNVGNVLLTLTNVSKTQ